MSHPTPSVRAPRARIDPIRSSAEALALVHLAIQHPLQAETVVFLLDDAGFGDTVIVVSGTEDADSMLSVVDCLATAGSTVPQLTSMVVASVRPHGGMQTDDIDLWLEASDIVHEHGLDLVEWFVIGTAGVECPREVFGEPERW